MYIFAIDGKLALWYTIYRRAVSPFQVVQVFPSGWWLIAWILSLLGTLFFVF